MEDRMIDIKSPNFDNSELDHISTTIGGAQVKIGVGLEVSKYTKVILSRSNSGTFK